MLFSRLAGAAVLALIACLSHQADAQPAEVIAGPELIVGRCEQPPRIDGILDDDAWTESAHVIFRDSVTAKPPLEKTEARVTYDADFLYLAFRCHESQMDKLVAIQTERNSTEIWKDDCIEIFLSPPFNPPMPGSYYQLMINSNGVFFANSPLSGKNWDPEIMVKSGRWEGGWTLEISIDFRSLLIGHSIYEGESWQANLNREQKTHGVNSLSGWSPVGGSFHTPRLFGRFRFADRRQSDGANSVAGQVMHEEDPLEGARVVMGKQFALTDAAGNFMLAKIPAGSHVLYITRDRFSPAVQRLQIDADLVIEEPFRLRAATPYGFDSPVTVLSPEKGYQIYFNHVNSPVWPGTAPPEDQQADKRDMTLRTVAVLDSYEPITFTVFTNEDLGKCRVAAGNLVRLEDPATTLDADLAEVRTVKVWIPPASMGGNGGYRPEILEPLTTAVDIPAKTFRQFWLTWHIPRDAKGGLYRGEIVFQPENKDQTVLHLDLTIYPFALDKPKNKRYGMFYLGGHGTSWLFNIDKQEKDYRGDFVDMRNHGVDGMTFPEPPVFKQDDGGTATIDFAPVDRTLALLEDIGWTDAVLIMNLSPMSYNMSEVTGISLQEALANRFNDAHIRLLGKTIRGVNRRVAEKGLPAPYYMWMDEITQYGEEAVKSWVRMGKVFREIGSGSKSIVTLEDDAPKRYWDLIAPYLDAAICSSTEHIGELSKAYPTISEWITYGGAGARGGAFKENRLEQGVMFYLEPASQSWSWVYQAIVKEQDGDVKYRWFTATVPAEDGSPVPTLQWEGYREGSKDLGYLVTLENEIVRHQSVDKNTEAVSRAREMLKSTTDELRRIGIGRQKSAYVRSVFLMQLENQRLDAMRVDIGNMISELQRQNHR